MEVVGRITLVGVNTTTDHIQMGFNLGHQPGEERKHLITVDGCKQEYVKASFFVSTWKLYIRHMWYLSGDVWEWSVISAFVLNACVSDTQAVKSKEFKAPQHSASNMFPSFQVGLIIFRNFQISSWNLWYKWGHTRLSEASHAVKAIQTDISI